LASDVLRKLVLMTLVSVLAIGVIVGVGYWQMERVFEGVNAANANAIPSLELLGRIQRDFLRTRNAIARHLLADAHDKPAVEVDLASLRKTVDAEFDAYERNGCLGASCVANAADGDYLHRDRLLWQRYEASIDRILANSRDGGAGFDPNRRNPAALDAARGLVLANNDTSRQLSDTIEAHVNINVMAAHAAAAEAARVRSTALVTQGLIGLALVVGLALTKYVLLRDLVGELRKLNAQIGGEPADAMRAAQQLAAGNVDVDLPLRAGDTNSIMASMQSVIATMRRLADRADTIGRGELDTEVPLASAKDRLGLAVNRMVGLLRGNRDEARRRDWIKDGLAQLAIALARDMQIGDAADTALSLIARYLGAGRGVVYLTAPGGDALELVASFMHIERDRIGARYRFGEGAIGQVARERKPIELQVGGADAAALAPVVTGTTTHAPRHTHTYPLLHETELLGVIELAGAHPLAALQREFLEAAAAMLAASLLVAQQRSRVREMLSASEASEQRLREQGDALKQTNALMEEQQQQLQQQTEALQQANAQMEEQQQQLQQQTEELQQANAQLEETQTRLEQQNRDLEQSRAEVDERARALDQASRYKSEFLANMSHELRTPLNSIILLSKMLGKGDQAQDEAEAREWARVIHRSGKDLLKLIDDVLDLAKVEAGRLEIQLAPLRTEELCAELRALFGPLAADKGLDFTIEDGLRTTLLVDAQKLGQILRNLLSNALKFCKKGRVSVTLARVADAALPLALCVRDTGIGIAADKQALVFEAFQQADGSTSREYGGTGLGLTISQRIAHLLGGHIELQSAPGEGSAFTVRLPEAALADADAAPPPGAVPAEAPPAHAPHATPAYAPRDDRDGLRPDDRVILLIDDDVALGHALVALNRRKGYKTLIAHAGADGLALARRYLPHGILLDLGLPDMDGAALLHQLKTDPQLSGIPVHIVSSRDRDEALLRDGAIGYLQKPVSDAALLSAQTALLVHVSRAAARGGGGGGERGVLLCEGASLHRDALQEVLPEGRLSVHELGAPLEPALEGLAPALAVVDLAGRSVAAAIALCEQLRAKRPGLPLVFYMDAPVGSEDEAALRRYSDSLIMRSGQSQQRLLANVERFLSAVPERPSPAGAAASQRLAGRRVLATDDDPRNLFVIVAALERHGCKVSTAVNGRKALEFLKHHDVDLMLVDIMMPEMDGYETLAALRAEPRWAALPVVVLSAKALPADRARMLAAGADDFLAKPVEYDALIETVLRWSQGRASLPS